MSKISDVYTQLLVRIGVLLPSALRLPNPYFLEQNTEKALSHGFGICLGDAENSNRHISRQLSVRRDVIVKLTRKYDAKDLDTLNKEIAEKAILEDKLKLIKDFETDSTLNGTAVFAEYVSDSGIEFINKTQSAFIGLEVRFSIEYFENLT